MVPASVSPHILVFLNALSTENQLGFSFASCVFLVMSEHHSSCVEELREMVSTPRSGHASFLVMPFVSRVGVASVQSAVELGLGFVVTIVTFRAPQTGLL